jgi:hypothetical protein
MALLMAVRILNKKATANHHGDRLLIRVKLAR